MLPVPLHRILLRAAYLVRLMIPRKWRQCRGCAVIVRDQRGQVLLVKHSYQNRDCWMLPAGGFIAGESPIGAAHREVHEEVGCRLVTAELMDFDSPTPAGIHAVVATTLDPPRPDGREVTEARFFPLWALPATLHGNASWLLGLVKDCTDLDGAIEAGSRKDAEPRPASTLPLRHRSYSRH